MTTPLAHEIEALLAVEPVDLARLALAIARIESPRLDAESAISELARLGEGAARTLAPLADAPITDRLHHLNQLLFEREGFDGNSLQYDDLRNSLLHVVLERRTGIPITLAVVYMTVARAAGLEVSGVSFPGHFLLRVTGEGSHADGPVILDPFERGQRLSHAQLRALLAAHAGDDAPWTDTLLMPCTSRQIAVRMLNNLKRLYVGMRCFQQAWQVTDALVTVGGHDPEDIRDRGLLAYHLDDFPAALSDLEAYVQVTGTAREGSEQRSQLWEHLSALRRRVASMN